MLDLQGNTGEDMTELRCATGDTFTVLSGKPRHSDVVLQFGESDVDNLKTFLELDALTQALGLTGRDSKALFKGYVVTAVEPLLHEYFSEERRVRVRAEVASRSSSQFKPVHYDLSHVMAYDRILTVASLLDLSRFTPSTMFNQLSIAIELCDEKSHGLNVWVFLYAPALQSRRGFFEPHTTVRIPAITEWNSKLRKCPPRSPLKFPERVVIFPEFPLDLRDVIYVVDLYGVGGHRRDG